MKLVRRIYTYNRETGERTIEDAEFDMIDAAGVLLEEGQKVWYARASKSAPAQLFQAKIKKLTSSSVNLEYTDKFSWRPEELSKAVLTSGHTNYDEKTYKFQQIAVIQ